MADLCEEAMDLSTYSSESRKGMCFNRKEIWSKTCWRLW